MELSKIEQLIAKYENAETSLQEEKALKAYFTQGEIAPEVEEYTPLFNYFAESSTERYTKSIPFQKKKANHWKWLSIAAAVVLMFSVYNYAGLNSGFTDKEKEEAQIALAETKKAFQLLSSNLNKGSNIAFTGIKEFDKTTSKVFK